MVTAAIYQALQVYGIAIVISVLVAVLIKVMVSVTGRMEKTKPLDIPTGTVCPIGIGVPDEDVAALSAAIFAAIGPHRILHIAPTSHGWAAGARASQHSHTPGPTGRGPR
jgi:Na+-transporting methylmalonyl-CoA/oxaloacetate decarboxylase gamma subunit